MRELGVNSQKSKVSKANSGVVPTRQTRGRRILQRVRSRSGKSSVAATGFTVEGWSVGEAGTSAGAWKLNRRLSMRVACRVWRWQETEF